MDNNGIEPTGNSRRCFSVRRLWPVGSCPALAQTWRKGSEALPVRRNKIKINKRQIRNKGINKTTVSALTLRIEMKERSLRCSDPVLSAQNKENRGALTNGSSMQKDARSSAAL